MFANAESSMDTVDHNTNMRRLGLEPAAIPSTTKTTLFPTTIAVENPAASAAVVHPITLQINLCCGLNPTVPIFSGASAPRAPSTPAQRRL